MFGYSYLLLSYKNSGLKANHVFNINLHPDVSDGLSERWKRIEILFIAKRDESQIRSLFTSLEISVQSFSLNDKYGWKPSTNNWSKLCVCDHPYDLRGNEPN